MDCLVIGGGVVGLSLAWELAKHGRRVQLIDRQQPGQEASWAGAGILPPANRRAALHPYDQLRGLSMELYPQWSQELRERTGIDNGYRRCGGIYLARSAGETAALIGWSAAAMEEQLAVERLNAESLRKLEPALAECAASVRAAYYLPEEAQIRNPRHLQALIAACGQCGVEIVADTEVVDMALQDGRIAALQTTRGPLSADRYCFTTGAWTGRLLKKIGLEIAVLPIRGQMVLFRCERQPFRAVLNEGPRYLVPREDGRVLVGATEEEVGFDKRTTDVAIQELRDLARELVPALREAVVEQTWAGLRPASFDGFPYLGKLPGLDNGYVAAGHFRSGLYLSPATAVVMRQVICGEKPEIDLTPFQTIR